MSRRVSSLTGPLPFRTLDTVATETLASRATSLIVTILLASVCPVASLRVSEPDGETAQLLADLFRLAHPGNGKGQSRDEICNRLHRGRQSQFADHLSGAAPSARPPQSSNFRG